MHGEPSSLGEAVARRFQLGALTAPPVRVQGGLLNRVWKVETAAGCFAVKELNLDRDWPTDFDAVFSLELAAWNAGVPMPRPVSDPQSGRPVAVVEPAEVSVLVHEWVDGQRVPDTAVTPELAARVGSAIAVIHGLAVSWPPQPRGDPMPTRRDWLALAHRAERCGLPWAPDLRRAAEDLATIGQRVGEWDQRDDARVVSHRDIGQKNLLDVAGGPVILDWEAAGPVPVAHELGATAVCLADGGGGEPAEEIMVALVRGYRDAGGVVPAPGPHWFSMWFSNWAHFLRWNVERVLTAASHRVPSTGASIDTANDVVARGLVAVRTSLARLDSLTDAIRDA